MDLGKVLQGRHFYMVRPYRSLILNLTKVLGVSSSSRQINFE